ncbi:uncharacterized protein LOC112572454 isoform X2 [Pomacea canaliculata]|uniref:uncharacterized protein LOC112572454 isoform X2 n=1 Tax=Pomacea canaliculata TaxID=400727 RepID=UPI000D7288B9|nr:uncharacterized protein LOC112572454 isoform X2 [Pomacea canaliculata]
MACILLSCPNINSNSVLTAELPCNCSSGCITTNRCLIDDPDCKKENVALNKTATMSSAYVNSEIQNSQGLHAWRSTATEVKQFFYKEQPPSTVGINCIHTSEWSSNPWWSVDLGAKFTITYVTIYNRDSNQKGLNSVKVYADEQLCHTISGINKDLIVNVTCDNPVRGQTIKLQKRGQSF